jgi:hypothetical protein
MVVVIVLNLGGEVERAREAFELLLWWLVIGALWFVDWRRLVRRRASGRSSSGRRSSRRRIIERAAWGARTRADVQQRI